MTPRELARVFEGKSRAARNQHDLVMQAAWTSASLGRLKKIPPLRNFLIVPPAKSKKSTWEELYAVGAAWAAAAGDILPPEVPA
jgi:hypothetical protein